jgi:hypothetical protein
LNYLASQRAHGLKGEAFERQGKKEAGLCALHQQQSAIIRKTELFSGRFITV